mmetsp:Transcript_14409/g.26713  ORF Transcript_14409/g.26713 Transcript_14409/m.26713 type:complete len:488 (-) Transcript_14409:10-1473(-)
MPSLAPLSSNMSTPSIRNARASEGMKKNMGLTGKKRAACERCFVLRRRCEFNDGAHACVRCERLGKKCVGRVDLRSKRSHAHKNQEQKNAQNSSAKSNSENVAPRPNKRVKVDPYAGSAYRSPRVTHYSRHQSPMSPTSTAPSTPIAERLPQQGVRMSLDAMEALYADQNVGEAAATLTSVFNLYNVPELPLKSLVGHLRETGHEESSRALEAKLHYNQASSNNDNVTTGPYGGPVAVQISQTLSDVMCGDMEPAFAVNVMPGENNLILNPAAELILLPRGTLESELKKISPFHVWMSFLFDKEARVDVWDQVMRSLATGRIVSPGVYRATCESTVRTIANRNRCVYSATMHMQVIASESGDRACFMFSFKNMMPTNEAATAQINQLYSKVSWNAHNAWQTGGQLAPLVLPPRQQSINSLGGSMLSLGRCHSFALSSDGESAMPPAGDDVIEYKKVFEEKPENEYLELEGMPPLDDQILFPDQESSW